MGRKWLKQEKRTKEQLFDALVKNALGFVETSLDHVKERPKNSIVDLYTAIELFLKARLMAEHWTLMLSKPETADLQNLYVGDFLSVYLDDALKRINSILGERIDTAASDNFKALGEHRNQIVHFAHSGHDDLAATQAGVIVEQWASWHYLYAMLTETWKDVFEPYKIELQKLNRRMMRQRDFLNSRFTILKPQIEIEVKKGKTIIACGHCELASAVAGEVHAWGTDYSCLVCGVSDTAVVKADIKLPCLGCNEEIEFFDATLTECPTCHFAFNTDSLIDLCTAHIHEGDQWWEEGAEHIASCHNCQCTRPSVFVIDGLWSCVSCFDRGWQAVTCEHCGAFVTGDMERIQYFACHKCEDQVRQEFASMAPVGAATEDGQDADKQA